MKREVRFFVEDILNSIEKVEDFSKGMTEKRLAEDELKQYVEKNIKSCINLDNWRNIGYEVNEDDVNVNVEIGERNVLVLMDYDISIIKDQVTQSENKFSQSLPVPIGLITQATKDIVASEIARGDFFDQPFHFFSQSAQGMFP